MAAPFEHQLEDEVSERGAGREGVRRGKTKTVADDLDADGVVGRGAGHDRGLDSEAVPEERGAAPGGDGVVRRKHDGAERAPDLRVVEDGFYPVRSEEAVPELEEDSVRLLRGESQEHGPRESGGVLGRRGDDSEVGEDQSGARARVLHGEDVPAR
jgi:hypothetical protein